jgi:hypothetical protein
MLAFEGIPAAARNIRRKTGIFQPLAAGEVRKVLGGMVLHAIVA